MTKKYQTLLFDFDGCIVSSIFFWINVTRETLNAFNVYPTDREIMFHIGDWDIHSYFDIEDGDKFISILNSKLKGNEGSQNLPGNVKEMLLELENSHKKAIVSSGLNANIVSTLELNNVDHFFELILGADDVKNVKPDPEPINKALKFLDSKAEDTVMIGDSRKDLEAASNAGVDSILYYPKEHELTHDFDMLMTYKPTFVVHSMLEIANIVS